MKTTQKERKKHIIYYARDIKHDKQKLFIMLVMMS